MDALLKYVEEQLAKGYSPQVIKDALVRQGYSPALVDGVLESVSMHQSSSAPPTLGSSHEKRVFPKLILIVVVLGVIIAGVIFVPDLIKGKEALLDVAATPDNLVFSAGEDLGFSLEIYNMGSSERFDISLIYRVLDQNDNAVMSKEETIAISTSTSHHRSIPLPNNINPGNYVMKIFANYEGKVATSSFSFEVKEPVAKESCFDRLKNQNEVGVDCGGVCGGYWYDNSCHTIPQTNGTVEPPVAEETCSDNKLNQDEVGVDCGGKCGGYWYDNSCHSSPKPVNPVVTKLSFAETMLKARAIAAANPSEAQSLCLALAIINEKDKCLKTIAEAAKKKEFCELIINTADKDSCYYPFFMMGDYSVCEKLVDPNSRQSCEQLKELSLISEQIKKGDQQALSNVTVNSTALDYFAD